MISIKTKEEIKILREGGRRLSKILNTLASQIKVGMTKIEVDKMAERLILEGGDIPALKNYKPYGASIPFPAVLCISVDDEIVHGIPNSYKLRPGDIVGLDLVIKHGGLFTDMAMTVPIGEISKEAKTLIEVTRQALEVGILAARGGAYTGDVGYAIESFIEPYHFGIVKELSGHGVGRSIHEEPYVPNYGEPNRGVKLKPGMVIAIEPMINLGGDQIILDKDKYTYRTKDGSLSAHFEKTVLITEGRAEVLTE